METKPFNDLINSSTPVLIDFYAEWCGPCKAMKPILENLKTRMGDKVKIVKIDVDNNQDIASQLEIRSIPTLIMFQNGKQVWKKIGVSNVAEMESVINGL